MKVNQQIKPFYFDISNNEIQYFLLESEKILKSGQLILGQHTTEFEKAFAEYVLKQDEDFPQRILFCRSQIKFNFPI